MQLPSAGKTELSKLLSLKPGAGQNIASHASPTARTDFRLPGSFHFIFLKPSSIMPRNGELRTQKLKSHLVRTQSLNVLPLKSGVGQNITDFLSGLSPAADWALDKK